MRLADEQPPDAAAAVRAALHCQVERALELPTRQALAVYSSASVELVLHLPLKVEDRVVVDPTFASRSRSAPGTPARTEEPSAGHRRQPSDDLREGSEDGAAHDQQHDRGGQHGPRGPT